MNDSLVSYLKDADKILLASHEDLQLIISKPGKSKTINRNIVVNGKPNYKIIKEKLQLETIQKQELIDIISNQQTDSIEHEAMCSIPHHTIFVYKEKKWSYIDICFSCKHYYSSGNLGVNIHEFLMTNKDWITLELFFRKLNLNYKMPE